MRVLGIIPARKGSKRVPGKNMALLNGRPLLEYTIQAALDSRVFDRVILTSNWDECLELGMKWGIAILRRPDRLCTDKSHDYEFVKHALDSYSWDFDAFVILRPTSPFRTGETIALALAQFLGATADSMRAVSLTNSHPRKSWVLAGEKMKPYVRNLNKVDGFPGYDMPTQTLGDVYIQNGCIHIAWTRVIEKYGNVSGKVIAPFVTRGLEGLDINTPMDLAFAEWLMTRRETCDGSE